MMTVCNDLYEYNYNGFEHDNLLTRKVTYIKIVKHKFYCMSKARVWEKSGTRGDGLKISWHF